MLNKILGFVFLVGLCLEWENAVKDVVDQTVYSG
jgi:hypothetical protein